MNKLISYPIVLLFTILYYVTAIAQSDTIAVSTNLPDDLKETSGIAASNLADHYWSHNNKFVNGDPFVLGDIHLFNANNGNIVRTLKINQNDIIAFSDMEDMTKDNNGNTYIADIGSNNNAGTKTVFRIYKINNIDAYNDGDTVVSEILDFSYPNNESYNAEGMFWHDNYLYIFNKGFANDTVTQSYRIPDNAGTYTAEFLETYINVDFSPAISAADINPQENTIALLAYQKIVLIKCFTAPYFFTNSEIVYKEFDGPQNTNTDFRTEAIMFLDEFNCIGTNEFKVNPDVSQSVFTVNLEDLVVNNFVCQDVDCGLIKNYNFNEDLLEWIPFTNAATSNANILVESGKAKLTMDDGGTARWNVRLKQEYFDSEIATTYKVSFNASANFDRAINVLIGQKIGGLYEGYFYQVVDLTINENYYEYFFTTTEPSNSFTRITFDCGNELFSEVYLDDICIEEEFCPFYAFVDDSISTANYKAASVFESRGQLKENAVVQFKADLFVNLKNDFSVPVSANFEAVIEDCE